MPYPGTYIGEDGTYYVQYTWATLNEYNVALALDKLEYQYIFQYSIDPLGGGNDELRGSMRLDFLVYTPWTQPVEVDVEYWHSGQRAGEEPLKDAVLVQMFGVPAIRLTADETATVDDATAALREKL